jgi:hypothetical protein
MPKSRRLLAVIAVPLLLLPAVIVIRAGVYDSWLENPLSGFGMWGAYCIYLWTRPPRREATLFLLCAAGIRVIHWGLMHEHGYPGSAVINIGNYLPLFIVPTLAYRAFRGPQQAIHRLSLFGILVFWYIGVTVSYYLSFAKMVCHYKLDLFLYAFDSSLGPHWNFWLAQVASSSTLQVFTNTIYNSMGLLPAVIFAAHIHLPKNRMNVLKLNILNPIIGLSLYFLYPAMGPRYAFPDFPAIPALNAHPTPLLVSGLPNAMPSLHFAATLITFFLARPWRWLRWATGLYLVAMTLAVLATGEHYVIDIIVAIPYSLMLLAYCTEPGTPGRNYTLAVSAGMVALWLVVLRFGPFHPALSRGMVIATIATSFLMGYRYSRTLWPALALPLPSVPEPAFRTAEARAD